MDSDGSKTDNCLPLDAIDNEQKCDRDCDLPVITEQFNCKS